MDDLEVVRLKGQHLNAAIEDLARLRFTVFREYPYLYDGNMEYEKKYLDTYVQCKESVLIAVKDKDEIVGVSTAIPLEFETTDCKRPFIEHRLPVNEIFYFGESVLLPQYRQRGVYRHFFNHREAAAKEYGSKIAAFCAVVRDEKDSRRPQNYTALDSVWQHFGYEKHPELLTQYKWKEIGSSEQTFKSMVFWMKTL